MMYEIKNSAQADTLDVYIYSDIGKSWWDDDDSMGAEKFRKLLEDNANAKFINIYINSYGGSVSEGVAIYSQIKRHKAFVTAYIDGFACSIASVIPMAADKVIMSDVSMMMIHNPWTITWGNSKDLRKEADDLDKILEGSIIPAYKAKCGDKISDEKLRELIDGESYLTSQECLDYGLCDEILASEKKDPKETAKEEVEDFNNKAIQEMKTQFFQSYAKAHGFVVQPEAVKTAAETAENAAEKQQEESHENVSDVSDNNVGNIENESEPEKEDKNPDTAEDTKAKINEYFMNLLKGEM